MATAESGSMEQDPQRLYPAISEEGGSEQQTAEFQRQQEEWRAELKSTEEDITTLRQLLDSKLRRSAELRRKLGLTPMAEIKHDLQESIKAVRESQALQKTNTALRSFGQVMSQKLTDLKNSQTVSKAMSNVGSAYRMTKSSTIDFIAARNTGPANGSESNGTSDGQNGHNGADNGAPTQSSSP